MAEIGVRSRYVPARWTVHPVGARVWLPREGRHGLRVSELVAMRWDMLDLKQGTFHVVRRKNGRPSVHLIRGDEIRALRQVEREQISGSPYVFVSERKGPMTVAAFRKLFTRIGAARWRPSLGRSDGTASSCVWRTAGS
jgi:integrase